MSSDAIATKLAAAAADDEKAARVSLRASLRLSFFESDDESDEEEEVVDWLAADEHDERSKEDAEQRKARALDPHAVGQSHSPQTLIFNRNFRSELSATTTTKQQATEVHG